MPMPIEGTLAESFFRIDLGRNPYIGANFRLRRGDDDVWSRFTLGLR